MDDAVGLIRSQIRYWILRLTHSGGDTKSLNRGERRQFGEESVLEVGAFIETDDLEMRHRSSICRSSRALPRPSQFVVDSDFVVKHINCGAMERCVFLIVVDWNQTQSHPDCTRVVAWYINNPTWYHVPGFLLVRPPCKSRLSN